MGSDAPHVANAPAISAKAAMESKKDKASRIRSIQIVRVAMFIFSLGFSIILTGVYPYMMQLMPKTARDNPERILNLYGWVVAINPLGQMLAAPLLGAITNRMGSMRLVCIVTSVAYIIGNIMYAILSVFPEDSRFWLLLTSRFIIGAASGNAACFIAYVSQSTYQHERTREMSLNSAAQSLGFIVGPGIQALLTPVKCTEHSEGSYIDLDMYTLSGWISALLGVGTLLLFMPVVFTEYDVTDKKKGVDAKPPRVEVRAIVLNEIFTENEVAAPATTSTPPMKLPSPDYVAVAVLVFCFWLFFINFVILETLGTPMCMDEFGWNESTTVLYLGIAMSVGGAISMASFVSIGPLSRRFDERKILLFLGIVPMIVVRLLMFPVGPGTAGDHRDNFTIEANHTHTLRDLFIRQANEMTFDFAFDPRTEPMARNEPCDDGEHEEPCSYDWCYHQPRLNMAQFFVGFLLVFFAYPYTVSLTQSLFSKVLGPRPQGVWMGVLTASGSLARVSGPIFITMVYNSEGLYVTFGIVEALMVVSLILVLLCYRKLVPLKLGEGFVIDPNAVQTFAAH